MGGGDAKAANQQLGWGPLDLSKYAGGAAISFACSVFSGSRAQRVCLGPLSGGCFCRESRLSTNSSGYGLSDRAAHPLSWERRDKVTFGAHCSKCLLGKLRNGYRGKEGLGVILPDLLGI